MTVMKKKLIIITVLVIALVTSYIFCGTDKNDTWIDSIKIEEYTAALSNKIDLDSIAGTYCGVLPPNVETTLILNPNRSLEIFPCKKLVYSKLYSCYSLFMLT